jgi:PAS domain S-box-containing protein
MQSNLRVEVRMLLPNGAIRWVEASGRMFHNQGGAPVRMMGTVTDITERKRAEEAMQQLTRRLERSNAELMALHEVARVLAGTINLRAVYRVMFREVAQRLLDAPYFSILLLDPATKGFFCTFQIADGQELETPPTWPDTSPMQTALQAREPHVVSLDEPPPHKSRTAEAENPPRLRSALYVPLLSGDHAIGVMVVQHTLPNAFSAADTTLLSVLASQAAVAIENAQLYAQTLHYADSMEQRVNERTQELQLERAQLRAILNGITEGVVYADLLQDRTQYVNLAFTRLTGFGSSDIVGQPRAVYRAILHTPAQPGGVAPLFDASGAYRNFWHGEVKIVRRDGSEFDAAVTISAILGDDAQPVAEVALVRDIGQEKLLQAQKDRFIASASHELRTPVSNLQMRLYLAKNQPEKLHDHLTAIERATRHLAHLIEDMLDVSRFERNQITLHPERVVLQEVIDGVLADERGQAESKLVALDQDLPDTPLYADVDADRFKQIVTNLLDNAINYTPEGGQVCIRLAREQREHGAAAVLSVQDTGVGISAKALPRIFEPFYRAAEGTARGTGLGLTIARELTELHGGRIVVESEPGKGSVFTVRIPLNE